MPHYENIARTEAVRRILRGHNDENEARDLLFLENWAVQSATDIAAMLRARQIRRVHPGLVTEIREERRRGHPLSDVERAGLRRS